MSETAINSGIGRNLDAHVRVSTGSSAHFPCLGLAIVHAVDNLLRQHLIGSRTKPSTPCVFFAVLGGMKAFGGLGVFIGTIILAITLGHLKFLAKKSALVTGALTAKHHSLHLHSTSWFPRGSA